MKVSLLKNIGCAYFIVRNSQGNQSFLIDVLDYNGCDSPNLDFLQNQQSIINPFFMDKTIDFESDKDIEIIGYTNQGIDKYENFSFRRCGKGNYSLGKPERFAWFNWYVNINGKSVAIPYERCKHLGLEDYFMLDDIVAFLSMEWAKRKNMNLSEMFPEEEIRKNGNWRWALNRVKFSTPDLTKIPTMYQGVVLPEGIDLQI
jgi:hypothetical protein